MMYTLFHLFFPLVNHQQAFLLSFTVKVFFLHVYLKLSITQLQEDAATVNLERIKQYSELLNNLRCAYTFKYTFRVSTDGELQRHEVLLARLYPQR